MGDYKFNMPNDFGIYLHDVPGHEKDLFKKDDRWISNGCIRLEDAQRLAKWLFGKPLKADGSKTEVNVDLPAPVPVYVTYLTAEAGPDGPNSAPIPTIAIPRCWRAISATASSRSRQSHPDSQ